MPNERQPSANEELQRRMQDPAFANWFNKLPPEEKRQKLQQLSTDYTGQRDIVNDQMATAAALRGTRSAQGQMVGDRYVAANPLQHVASAYKQRQGYDQEQEAIARKKELSDMQSSGLGSVMGSLLRSDDDEDDSWYR
jgi:hypothetical protein